MNQAEPNYFSTYAILITQSFHYGQDVTQGHIIRVMFLKKLKNNVF